MSDFIVFLQLIAVVILLCVAAVIAMLIAGWLLLTLYALLKKPISCVFDKWHEWYEWRVK